MAKFGGGPETVAKKIQKAIIRPSLRTRYKVTHVGGVDDGDAQGDDGPDVGPVRGRAQYPQPKAGA